MLVCAFRADLCQKITSIYWKCCNEYLCIFTKGWPYVEQTECFWQENNLNILSPWAGVSWSVGGGGRLRWFYGPLSDRGCKDFGVKVDWFELDSQWLWYDILVSKSSCCAPQWKEHQITAVHILMHLLCVCVHHVDVLVSEGCRVRERVRSGVSLRG